MKNICTGIFKWNRLLWAMLMAILFWGEACKKKDQKPPGSSVKLINEFRLLAAENPALTADIAGIFSRDTIYLFLPAGVSERSFVPKIRFTGSSVSPATGILQDFSTVVVYTVKAEDGSTKAFYVVTRALSDEKSIQSFILEKSVNPSLDADIIGEIQGESIALALPAASISSSLVPTIVYTGKSLSPAGGTAGNFNNPVSYTVTAEDGSFRNYNVFSSYNQTVYAGSEDGYLYALDARTGRMERRWNLGSPVQSNPILYNGNLYACSGNGTLFCIDPVSGSVRWTHQSDAMTGTNAAPIAYNGAIFYNDFLLNTIYSEGGIYSVNATTGARRWKVPRELAVSMTMNNGVFYSPQRFYSMYAIDWNTGVNLWNNLVSPIGFSSNPCYWNNMIFADGELMDMIAVDLSSPGTMKWHYLNGTLGGASFAPTVYNNKLYCDNGANLNCLDPLTGSLVWRYSTPFSGFRPPVGMNGIIYCNTRGGELYAVNAETGSLVWKFGSYQNTSSSLGNVTAANNTVYLGNWNNSITALNATTGSVLWAYIGTRPFYSGILVVDKAGAQYHSGISGNQQ
ncbi:MAG: PQQ-binding-like beta-propeller repeat protein [Sphingobacteriales bacterium]|nr:PQQ-binding-like beta-propeller repeat protein [Sphingobacteriales bacterium]